MIATYGSKNFNVSMDKIYTFDGLNISATLNTEKQENDNEKPSTYIKNLSLICFNTKIKASVEQGINPLTELNDWISLLNSKTAYPFILGGKPLFNTKFLLTSVTTSEEKFDNEGNLLSIVISLKFDEYVRAGKATSSTLTSSSTTTSSINNNNTSEVYEALRPEDKSELKVEEKPYIPTNELLNNIFNTNSNTYEKRSQISF